MRLSSELWVFLGSAAGVLALDNGVGVTPAMGWSSWNLFACNINETLIKQMADALVSSGLSALGYSYINLDDCWQSSRDGVIIADPLTFPSGIPALADYIHSKGLKLGIYSSAGSMTCEKRPGSLTFEETDARTYAEWGVDYFKYDNCYEEGLSDWEGTVYRYSTMRDALNRTGRPIVYSICNWGFVKPWEFGKIMANSWRSTSDICDSFDGWWCSAMSILDLNIDLTRFSGPGGFNDLDMLEVGNGGMTLTQYQTHFSAWAALKSPLILGNDLRVMSDDIRDILSNSEVIRINQDKLGQSAHLIQRLRGTLDVWAGELSEGERVVMVINRGRRVELNVKVESKVYGGENIDYVHAKDLWTGIVISGNSTDGLMVESILPHGVAMLRIMKPVDDLQGSFKPVIPPPTGTFRTWTHWWYPLVMFVRWYQTMTPAGRDGFHLALGTAALGHVLIMVGLRWRLSRAG